MACIYEMTDLKPVRKHSVSSNSEEPIVGASSSERQPLFSSDVDWSEEDLYSTFCDLKKPHRPWSIYVDQDNCLTFASRLSSDGSYVPCFVVQPIDHEEQLQRSSTSDWWCWLPQWSWLQWLGLQVHKQE